MKKVFSVSEAVAASGCHKNDEHWISDRLNLLLNKNINISIFDILECNQINMSDKRWFIINQCNLSTKEMQYWALCSAKSVANIYNDVYPNDNRISMCINITSRYLKGLVSKNVLIKYMEQAQTAKTYTDYTDYADTAGNAAYAAYNAANAAYTAYTVYAAYTDYADIAAYAAMYAADADNTTETTKLIKNWIKLFKTFDETN